MKNDEKEKIVLDLDKYSGGKKLRELTPEEMAKILEPFNLQFAEITKTTAMISESLREPLLQVAKITETINFPQIIGVQNSMARIMENSVNITTPMAEAFASMIDSRRIAQSLFESIQPSLDLFKNSIIDLNTLNSIGKIGESTLIGLQIESARQISETEAVIESSAKTETSFKSVSFVQKAELSIVVSAVNNKIEEKFEQQGQELSDIKQMLRQLVEKGAQSLPAMVSSFKFDFDSLVLIINDKPIVFQRPSKQTEVCRLFFSNTEDITRRLHIEEIIEEFEGINTVDQIKVWNNQFYQAVRHLNDKIAIATGLKDFIKVTNQYYEINPEYRKLF